MRPDMTCPLCGNGPRRFPVQSFVAGTHKDEALNPHHIDSWILQDLAEAGPGASEAIASHLRRAPLEGPGVSPQLSLGLVSRIWFFWDIV